MNRKERRRQAHEQNAESSLAESLNSLIENFEAGRLLEALVDAKRILAVQPEEPDVLNLAGAINARLGRHGEALAFADKLLSFQPDHREGLMTRVQALMALGRREDVAEALRSAIDADPQDNDSLADLQFQLGGALQDAGDFDGAAQALQAAIAIRPAFPEALLNLGNLVQAAGLENLAIDLYRRALEVKPDYAEAWNNLGTAFRAQGMAAKAVGALERAVLLRPDNREAHNNLGTALQALGDVDAAVAAYRNAIRLDDGIADQHANLGHALRDSDKLSEALSAYEAALTRDPNHDGAAAFQFLTKQDLCAWDGWDDALRQLDDATAAALAGGVKTRETPFINIGRCDDVAMNLAVARSWGADLERRAARVENPFEDVIRPAGDGRIRLGYMSSDFREHALMHLMRTVFGLHNRDEFVTYLYAIGPDDGGPHRKRAEADADVFVDLTGIDDLEAARRIRADGIDIFIDLKGYTQGARMGISAIRPAPVQVSYMGFPGTTGVRFFDYVLGDPIVTPADHQPQYNETFAWMPHCYMVNDHTQEIAATPVSRADEGLPEDSFIFCSFNRAPKFDPIMFDAWMRILQQVPDSVLWLFVEDEMAQTNLRREAERAGVDAERVVFAGRRAKAEHLARVGLADLGLDTRIYGGHTTTCDTLWAGVPVVTVCGRHFASRVSASILAAADLPDLITESMEDFEAKAVGLAKDQQALAAIKARLGAANAELPLFDTPGWVRDWEQLLRQMWSRHQAGLPPQFLTVEAGPASG